MCSEGSSSIYCECYIATKIICTVIPSFSPSCLLSMECVNSQLATPCTKLSVAKGKQNLQNEGGGKEVQGDQFKMGAN